MEIYLTVSAAMINKKKRKKPGCHNSFKNSFKEKVVKIYNMWVLVINERCS